MSTRGASRTGPVPRVAWYRFRATFRRRWSGYVALAVLVGLVGGVALASVAAARRTDSSYPDYLAGTNPSDLIVQPTTTPPYAPAFLDGQLARLKHVRHVETTEGFNAATLTPHGQIAEFLITQVELVASLNGLYSDQDRLTIVRGRRANPERADQVVATTQAASVLGLHVGSRISVGIAAGRWLWLAFAGELAAVPDPVIPAASIALAAAAALILANLVAAIPGQRAARTPAATVLRAE